ncbi:MAG: S46 family peptidase, partial [Steroidobacteraceae bacterium]
VKDKYGVDITPQWLDHVRLSTGRLAYCTASFVSPEGLMLTNHHCVARCVAEHSSRESSLVQTGFIADRREKEKRCGTQVVDVLTTIEDVTAIVRASTRNVGDTAANEARKQTLTKLEQSCEATASKSKSPLRCQAVTLYEGGQYLLYKYQRYDDVRLVFSPEAAIAAFGGDPDNFQFPRWCLDMGLLRAYENGKPARTPNYLQIDFEGPAAGEPVFVVGNPMSTQRLLTLAQLKAIRQTELPPTLVRLSELRGRYLQFAAGGVEAERVVHVPMMAIENRLKIGRKLMDSLLDEDLIAAKASEEQQLRAAVAANGELQRELGDPWEKIARAEAANYAISPAYSLLESAAGFESRLFRYARLLARGAEERAKPNEQRLHDYSDTALPRIEQEIRADVPVYAELEQINLSTWLARMQEWLGPD